MEIILTEIKYLLLEIDKIFLGQKASIPNQGSLATASIAIPGLEISFIIGKIT